MNNNTVRQEAESSEESDQSEEDEDNKGQGHSDQSDSDSESHDIEQTTSTTGHKLDDDEAFALQLLRGGK